MTKYERGKKWIEMLDSIKTVNSFKELIKGENTYLESLFSSPTGKAPCYPWLFII